MAYFPFFMDLFGKKGLIVGGGHVAKNKIDKLLDFEPELTVIAPELISEIENNTKLNIIRRKYVTGDEDNFFFVIAATNDKEINRIISQRCQEKKIPVNVVDNPELCSFIFPSIVKEGKLIVGISTSGSSPTAAKEIKNKIRNIIPSTFDEILDYLHEERNHIKKTVTSEQERQKILQNLFIEAMNKKCPLSPEPPKDSIEKNKGIVYIIGAGCGKWDLITVRGLKKLKEADVVIYDDLIDKELLEQAENAELIYMGKRAGQHSANQEEISDKLIELAKSGKVVARLKGGDPFVFGRGGEEIIALQKENIQFELIPGISSAIAIPAFEGIPVTHRNVSRGFMVVTGHTCNEKDDKDEKDEIEIINSMVNFPGTIVILMGLGKIEQITEKLINMGKNPQEPVAVISGGNAQMPVNVKGTLSSIAKEVEKVGVKAPAVIVIGKTVEMNLGKGASE